MKDTATEELREFAIGEKIKRLRLRKSMGLVELGRHTSLSPAMLSKLEHGHVIPTLQTLMRIALTFSVGLEYFFTDDTKKKITVVRKDEQEMFHEIIDGKKVSYKFACLDYKAVERKSSAYLADFSAMPPEDIPTHTHQGSEFIFVLEGKLGLKFEAQEVQLNPGDSTYFDPTYHHGYRKIGNEPCKAIIFTVP